MPGPLFNSTVGRGRDAVSKKRSRATPASEHNQPGEITTTRIQSNHIHTSGLELFAQIMFWRSDRFRPGFRPIMESIPDARLAELEPHAALRGGEPPRSTNRPLVLRPWWLHRHPGRSIPFAPAKPLCHYRVHGTAFFANLRRERAAQNGKPIEKCRVPAGSCGRRFRLWPYSSRTGPITVFQRIPPPTEYRRSLNG